MGNEALRFASHAGRQLRAGFERPWHVMQEVSVCAALRKQDLQVRAGKTHLTGA